MNSPISLIYSKVTESNSPISYVVSGDARLAPPPRGYTEEQTVTVISITPSEPRVLAAARSPERRPLGAATTLATASRSPERRPVITAWAEQPEDDPRRREGADSATRTVSQLYRSSLAEEEEEEEEDDQQAEQLTGSGWRRLTNQRIATNGSLTGTVNYGQTIAQGHHLTQRL